MDELWAKSTNIEEDETVDNVVRNRVDRILLGIKPINPNTDLRGTPTIDTTPHTEPKNVAQKIGDGISYVADGIKKTASEWADNRLQNMSMDIYSNLYDPDPDKEKRLQQAHEIGDPLGLPAQMLVDSKEAYEMAQNQYAWMRTQEIMQGKAFSANALKELYPELVDIAMDDPVSASLALKKADQILHDRGIIVGASPLSMTGEPSVLEETFKTFANAWEAGQNMDKISEIGYKAKNGEITIDEMNNRIEKINKQTKEYEGESLPGIIATETVKNISMMSTQMLRSAPVGLAAGVGLMTVVGAPLVGAALVATIFYSSLRSNAGSNYYRLVNKRNSDGSRMYTDGEAKKMADREAVMQAAVETGLMTVAYGSLGKVFGKGIAKAAIMNASTRNKLLSASRGAMRKYAAKEAAKQYVKGTAAEVAEEGWQDLISTTDEWLVGKDKTINAKAMWNSAVNAMFEALPAAIGMGLPGAVLSGGGNYLGLKNLTKEDWTMAREAYYRENEKNMTNTILKERDSNAIFKISPKVFAQKTQAQMDKAGMGTVYIDAATAAETKKGREALNRLVEEEIATQEQVDSAVKDGSQLELKSGVYMQKVNEETAGILSDYAAFDKNGKTIHEINEARQRLIKTINLVNQTKEKREQEVAETILERDFEEGLEKEAMRKIFAEGMDDIKGNYKKLKEEAFKAYGDLIGYDHYAGYTPLGVDLVPVEAGAKNYQTGEIETTGHVGDRYIRQSNNETWYSDAWKKYGRKPNKRELYDIAERETIKEIDSAVYTEEERKQALDTIEQARKEAETFEQLEDYINGLDTKEITERTLLSEKAYNMVYLPTIEALKNAPAKVAEAKRESAFIYARMVDNFAEMYKLPIENIVASLQINDIGVNGYRQAMFDVRKAGIVSIDTFYNRVTAGVKKGESPTKIKYTSQSGVTYAGDRMVHIIKHGFSKEDIIDLDKSMNNLYDPVFTTWQDGNFEGQHRGDHILAKVKGDHGNYYVVLSFSKNGIVWIDTAVKEKDGGIYKKEIEDKRARRLTDETAASSSHHLTPISISTIQKELGIVKKEKYYQRLSPYKAESYTADELETTATITGKEFGEYTDIKDLRAKALTYYKEHLQGTFAHNDLLGDIRLSDEAITKDGEPGDVKLTGKGKKKMSYASGNPFKLLAVIHLKDIISDANIISIAKSQKEKHNGWMFYYLHSAIDTPDGKQYVVVTVADKGEGSVDYYNHNVFTLSAYKAIEKATGETSSKGFTKTPQKSHEVASSIHSIYEAEEIYKRDKNFDKNLVALHNISAENLGKAIKLGGFPVPSIAVTKKQTPYTKFGEITLIMDKNVANPERENVYTRDVWTTTFPQILRKPIQKVLIPLTKDFDVAEKETGLANKASYVEVLNSWSEADAYVKLKDALHSPLGKYVYLKSISKAPDIIYRKNYQGNQVVDDSVLKEEIENKIADKDVQKGYDSWVENITSTALDFPKIKVGRKKLPMTLDNLVSAMKGNTQNKQKNILGGMSIGNVIAAGGKTVKNIKELHKEADKTLAPEKDTAGAYESVKEQVDNIITDIISHAKDKNDFQNIGNAASVLVDVQKKKMSLSSALNKHHFEVTPEELKDLQGKVSEVTNAIENLPVNYFEAKPNRAVGFNEVKAAVIPKGMPKEMKDFLSAQGIIVNEYDPEQDGHREQVTNEAQEKAGMYFQSANQNEDKYAGAYDAGENAIHIFSAGNQSTVVHEAAHWWLSMLSRIAEDKEFEEISKENPQMEAALKKAKKDRMDIRAWAMYAPEVMKEYKGTVLEKEFNAYEKEIQQNPRDKELQERFIQERFARGFERYLMTGKAPTKELQGAFRRFKKWMISVYRTTKEIMKNPQQALGLKEPPAEIKDIFDHMLATEEEINAWSAEKRLHTIYDTGIDYTKTEKENVAGWLEDIKETIKEEALSYFMHQIKGEQMQNFETRQLPEMMETFKEQLIYNPVYRLEALRSKNLFPTKEMWNKALEAEGYTEETYIKAVKEAGGSIEEQVKNFEKTQRENFKSSLSDKDYIRRLAEEKMESEEGKAKLAEIEKEMLGKRIKKYGRVAAAALLELERIEKKDVKNTAWKVIYEIKKENGLLTKEDEEHGDKVKNEEIEELKLQIAGIQNGLNEAAASLYYTPTDLKQEARAFLYGKEIYKATNYKWWNRKAEAEGRKAAEAMKERHWSTAAYRKQRQLRFSYNALMAKEYDDHIRTVLHGNPKASTDIYDKDGLEKYGIIGLINRVSKRDSSIQMKNNARYFIHHLAFQLGLITKDGNAPLDGAGNPAPFDWKNLNAEIDVLSVMEGQSPEDIVPQWIKTIFERKDKTNIRDLPVVDFDELVEVCKEVYKMGRREYEGNTFAGENGKLLSFSDAAEIIVDKMGISFENPKLKKLGETKLKKIKDKAGNWVGELALPEIFIERMGPEIYNLIYKPMDNAFQVKRKLESEAREKFKEIMNIYPDRETWRKIRADKIYKLTEDVDGKPVIVTKEILLSIALNMGTKTNQERVSETYGMTYNAIMNALEKYMDNRDWDFVEAVWEHINSYWPQRNIVQNSLYGVPLGKVPGQTIVLSNGRKIKGMYYPIKYDGELSSKTKERELNDIVRKEMLGSHTFNIGMGSTKKRAEGSGGQYIRDDLEVYIEYINESINHIAMRETTADIYKLLARKDVAEAITDRYGSEAHRRLLQWATDCWHDPVDKLGNLERYLDRMRKKFTMATMGYRISTALLNLANIPLVIEKTGPRNFIRGLSDMYMSGADKYREQRAFIFEKSSFMKERATTMDRDLARGLRMKEDRGTSKAVSKIKGGKEIIDQYGFSLIAETDFMFSLPEWIQTYNNTVFELQMKRNMTAEEIEKEAVRKADKIVRETFGSGEMKDRPAVVKSRFLSQLLPFYSYTSLVLNQFIRGGYDIVDGKGPGKLIRSFIFWYLFGAAFEGALRYLVDQATGNDKYTFLGRLGYSYASNGPVSGLPVARDVVPAMYSLFMGMYSDGAVPEVSGLQIIEDIYKTGSAVKSDNKDWIDVGQAATKTTNKLTGLSDTVTDGLWAIARLTFTDTDATAFESIASILFDRKIKKKGERK